MRVSTLINAYGQLVSASSAQPNIPYVGVCCSFVVNHNAGGKPDSAIIQIYSSPLMASGYYSSSYIQGGAGGSFTLLAQAAVLGGQIYSTVVTGEKQRTITTAPTSAALTINNVDVPASLNVIYGTAYSADNIILSDAAATTATQWTTGFTVGSDLNALFTANAAAPNSVYVPSSWLNSGLRNISLAANNTISLPAGNPISLPAGGSFSASANTVDIESPITAPGGSITLTGAYTTSSSYVTNPNSSLSARSGLVNIGAGVIVSAAGAWTNDASSAPVAGSIVPIALDGGTVAINSYGDINLGQGSVLDVSGGAHETAAGKITAGKGGTSTLAAGLPLPVTQNVQGSSGVVVEPLGFIHFGGGSLAPGQLRGYGVGTAGGGSLTVGTTSAVAAVPEASTWAMLVLGFAGLGLLSYRRTHRNGGLNLRFA